ncbi:hypothetical protein PS639_04638 [Pseudomonas fluorescens]|nr:hypothetical protein PS639_04638 [Pseudomonas fluorescens]
MVDEVEQAALPLAAVSSGMMLAGRTLSRASSLPQVLRLDVRLWSAYKLCGGSARASWLFYSSCFCRVISVLNILGRRLFKRAVGYFAQATTPCAIAYGYARICRLVRLGPGLYRLQVAEKQRWGLVAPGDRKVPSIMMRSVCSNLHYGGHAQGVFGRAGLLTSRSTNLRMAATLVW